MRSSFGARADTEYREAEAERERRSQAGLCFASVRHSVRFLWERGPAMQSALGCHPRGEIAEDGSTVYLQVDGGQGGDIHEVLCTLQSIHDALCFLMEELPVAHLMFVEHFRNGKTFVELGKIAQCSPSTASAEVGKAETFLLACLREAGVVHRGRAVKS